MVLSIPPSSLTPGLTSRDFSQGTIDKGDLKDFDSRDKPELKPVLKAVDKSDNAGRLLRAFPNVYYGDIGKNVPPQRIPGGTGVVVGDSHPGNFGWLNIDGKTIFGVVDLDDCGYAPVALDVLHYLTTITEQFDDPALVQRLLAKYVEVVFNRTASIAPNPGLQPDWNAQKHQLLDAKTKDDHTAFKHEGALLPIDDKKTKQAVIAAVTPYIDGAEILDTAVRVHETGGSGGYERYWILTNHKDADGTKRKEIIELKQAGPPGVASLDPNQLRGNARLTLLRQTFWGADGGDDHVDVQVQDGTFELRRKMRMAVLDPRDKDLSAADRENVLMSQVSVLANLHRPAWLKTNTSKDDMTQWLQTSLPTLVKRWQDAYDNIAK